ncbi:potassium voltage-gated channel subfamily A member 1-like [Clytia hemisphaerica]|uniref:potassium voltage-gated channel subfamily A member 1-like n=1 Tax=Clytia hemisphaerica TaxID=252671 RepID=UPI0034D3C24D
MDTKERIRFNVSGQTYETYVSTIQRFPKTLLGSATSRNKYYCHKLNQYFFNRNHHAFEAILFFYQSNGTLSRPQNVSVDCFEKECEFFCLPEVAMATMRTNEGRELVHSLRNISFTTKYDNSTRRLRIWNIFENPYSSCLAMKMTIFQIAAITVSIVINCVETIPGIAGTETNKIDKNPWLMMEIILSGWFLLEFTLRAFCTPNWRRFLFTSLNWIDLFGIPPYLYINHQTDNKYLEILQFFRFFRALRIFRLVKCSRRLKAVMIIFQDSLKDLQLFFVCLFIIVVFGASVLYFLEKDAPDTHFISVPDSMWWGVQTFLTLGYGDISPTTPLGKMFSSLFMVFGVTTMSLPVLSLIMKFSAYSKVM